MFAVVYARRSSDTEDRQTLSIEQQLDELRQLAFARGIEIQEELTESCSASQPGRPVFAELMKRIRKGEVDGILVWKLDRLARNMVDGGQIIYELDQGHLKQIVTPEAIYTDTGDSKFMLVMLIGAAAKYTDDLAAAIRRGNKDTLRKGKVPGPVPLGYTKTHEHELVPSTGIVIPDPERFDLMKRVWAELLGGDANVSSIWRKATTWGLTTRPTKNLLARPITVSNLYKLLRNPFYAGRLEVRGESYKGEHVPMVTESQFNRAQELLSKRPHQPHTSHASKHEFLYQGLLHCGRCSRALSGESHTSTSGVVHVYYRCGRRRPGYVRCNEPAIREHVLVSAQDRGFLDSPR